LPAGQRRSNLPVRAVATIRRVTDPLRKPLYTRLYVQVLAGIALGVAVGLVSPEQAAAMKPLGDGFIKLVKMVISPIVFTTVVVGIAHIGAMKDVGRIGLRALIYFELVSTAALVIGLVAVTLLQPGAGIGFDPAAVVADTVPQDRGTPQAPGAVDFLMGVIPDTVVGAFARGDVLPVLLFSVLFGMALLRLGSRVSRVPAALSMVSDTLFDVIGMIMRLAPIGAFGAMAFTVGRHGIASLVPLGQLMAGLYITCAIFVVVVLGPIAAAAGVNVFKLLKYIGEEILIVLGTSSSESVLPRIMAKMERLGCTKPVVGLVVPTGYSFNLEGTSIYLTMGAVFVAQASGVHLTVGQLFGILGVLLLTSKGAAAVTGSGFVTLAATLEAFPAIPAAGLALLIGVDRFMSEARAVTNLIGNAVATVAIARWHGALDVARARRILDGESVPGAPVDVDEPPPKASLATE
jgi:aerobic C4-dicarboxylate transport protein